MITSNSFVLFNWQNSPCSSTVKPSRPKEFLQRNFYRRDSFPDSALVLSCLSPSSLLKVGDQGTTFGPPLSNHWSNRQFTLRFLTEPERMFSSVLLKRRRRIPPSSRARRRCIVNLRRRDTNWYCSSSYALPSIVTVGL